MSLHLLDLPQELVDRIMDQLVDDPPTLSSTSLVCRRFHPTSQIHAFSAIHLHPGRYAKRISSGNLYPAFHALLERSPHIAPLVTTLRVSDLAGLGMRGSDLTGFGRYADETALFSDIAVALGNVRELIVDSKDNNGMPWHYVPNARLVGLRHLIVGHTLRKLAFRRVALDWSFVLVIAQCASLRELRLERSTIDEGVYPAAELAALDATRPVLSSLILWMQPGEHALTWDDAPFQKFVNGLIAGDWADVSRLQYIEFSQSTFPEMHHSAMQELIYHVSELGEFVLWRHGIAQLFDVEHVKKVTVTDF